MNNISKYFQELSFVKKIFVNYFLLLVISILDFISGTEISFSIFYLIPVTLTALSLGKSQGIIISIASAFLWYFADYLGGTVYSPFVVLWNSIVRLGFFLVVTLMITKVQEQKVIEEELTHFLVHDLKSPLSNILGSLEILKEDKQDELTSNELLDLSIGSSKKMMLFINSFLDLGRLKNKKMPVTKTDINIAEILEASINQTKIIAVEKNIEVKTQINVKSIFADEFLLLRIITNLLNNAIKVSHSNSKIIIETNMTENNLVEFRLKDFGPGIKKGMENQLFNKYEQLDYRKKGGVIGSGLGLTFCKAAVEVQGGNIWMESEENKGTTIIFLLPNKGAS